MGATPVGARAEHDARRRRRPPRTMRRGRQAMSYSPGSTSDRSSPSTTTTPAPSSAWWAGEAPVLEAVDREVVEAHELEARLREVGRRVAGQVDEVFLELGDASSCPDMRVFSSTRRSSRRSSGLEVGALDALAGRRSRRRGPCPSGSRAAARPPSRPPATKWTGASTWVPAVGAEAEPAQVVGRARPARCMSSTQERRVAREARPARGRAAP